MSLSRKVLITGGTGFVGHHLRAALAADGVPHYAFSKATCDLTDPAQTDCLFAAHRDADVIIHLASYQAAGDFPARHPAEQLLINSRIHLNVLDAWRRLLPHAKLVAVGTSCAYPSEGPLVEDRFLDGAVHGSVSAYAVTKRLLYSGIRAFGDQYGLNGSCLIPPTLFGEYDDFHVQTAHVPGALIGKFVRAVREGLPEVEIWGDGTQVREFADVKEFVRALLHLLPRLDRDLVNVGPGRGLSIRTLAETIRDAAEYPGRLVFRADRYVGVREKFMNTNRLREKYAYTMPLDIRDGIRRTVQWYAAHYDALKDRPKFAACAA